MAPKRNRRASSSTTPSFRTAAGKRALLAAIVDSSQDAIYAGDNDGVILSWNLGAERLFGYTAADVVGRSIAILYPPGHEEERKRVMAGARGGGPPTRIETVRRRKDGSLFPVAITISPIRDAKGTIIGASAIAQDLSGRQRAQEALRLSEQRFTRVFMSVPAGIAVSDPAEGRLLDVNDEFARIFGYAREELIGRTTLELGLWLDPADRERALRDVRAAGATRGVELRMRAKGDRLIVVHASFDLTEVSGRVLLLSSFIDVTARARAQEELRRSQEELRALARRLQSVREEEHTRMAREIHDEVGQGLTALRLDASWLAAKLPDAIEPVRHRVAGMVRLADETIEAGRRIVAELRPPILDDLGLVPALEWHLDRFTSRAGLRPTLEVGPDTPDLPRDLAVTAYRIVQEALTNVARHARASRVVVRLGRQQGALTLEVRDDGRGIPADVGTRRGSYGIIGMRERALNCGGSLTVEPAPGGGTSVRAVIPLEQPARAEDAP